MALLRSSLTCDARICCRLCTPEIMARSVSTPRVFDPAVGIEAGESTHRDRREVIEMSSFAQHRQLTVHLAGVHVGRFQQKNRSRQTRQVLSGRRGNHVQVPSDQPPFCAAGALFERTALRQRLTGRGGPAQRLSDARARPNRRPRADGGIAPRHARSCRPAVPPPRLCHRQHARHRGGVRHQGRQPLLPLPIQGADRHGNARHRAGHGVRGGAPRRRVAPAGCPLEQRLRAAVGAHLHALLERDDYTGANIRIFGHVPERVRGAAPSRKAPSCGSCGCSCWAQ